MSLDDIEIFAKVVEQKGFSKASQLLRLPKSTISRRLTQLEDRLGVKLLNRTTRQLSLTPIGQAYYEKCIVVLERLDEAHDVIKGLQVAPKGRLRLTVPQELGLFYLKDILSDFLKAYPDIVLELELANRIVDLVEEGIDLAIRIGHLPDSSLMAVKLLDMQGGVYASPEFLQNNPLPLHPLEIQKDKCIQFRPTTQTKPWRFYHEREGQIDVLPAGPIQVNSMDYVCKFTVEGLGMAVINKMVAAPYAQAGQLIEILKEYKLTFPSIFAIYPSRKFLSPNVRTFIDYIKPRLSGMQSP